MADGLDLQLLEKFNKQLDATYTKLQQLDAELQKFAKLSTVDVKAGPGLKATARALDELARAMSRFRSASPEAIGTAVKNLVEFVSAFGKAAGSTGATNANLTVFGKFLKQVRTTLEEMNAIQASVAALSSGTKAQAQDFIKTTIEPLITSVIRLIDLGRGLTPERLRALGENFRQIGYLFAVLRDSVTALGAIQGALKVNIFRNDPFKQFQKILDTITGFFSIAQNLTPDRLKNLGETIKGLEALFRTLGNAVDVLNGLQTKFRFPTSLFRALSLFKRIIQPFLEIADAVAKLGRETDPSVFGHFATFITGLGNAVTIINDLQGKFHGFGSIIRNLNTFKRIGGALADVVGYFAKIKTVDSTVFTNLTPLLDSLGRSIKVLVRLDTEFRKFGSLFRSLNIFKRIAGALKDVFKSFAGVKGGGDTLIGISKALPALDTLVKSLILLNNDKNSFKGIGKTLGEFKNIGKAIGDVFKNLRKGIGNADTKGIGDILKVLPEIAKSTQGFTGNKEFPVFIKDLGNALKTFKVDKNVAKALQGLGDTLKTLKEFGDFGKLERALGQELPSSANKARFSFEKLKDTIRTAVVQGLVIFELLKAGLKAIFALVQGGIKLFANFFFPPTIVARNLQTLRQISEALTRIGQQMIALGQQFKTFGTQLINNFGLGNLFQSAAVQSAIGFDQLSTQVQTFGNLSDEATEQAQALAFEIGQKFPLSANDALAAILDLIKAGQDLGSIEFVLPAASNLAALSETGDLNNVIGTLIAAEGAFDTFALGVEGTFENIAIATDIIAAGANVSTASVESLGEGLANVGTAANSFGLSLEETVAVLSIFNDAGLQAAEGGTALRSLLNALDRPQTATALRNLGISLFDPETGTRRPLNDIITDINAALEGMPDAQRVAVLQQLSDTFGRQGLNILLAEGEDGINAVVAEMNALPTAAQQASDLLNNLAGDMEQLKGSFETFMLRAALPILDRFFRPFVQLGRLVIDSILTLDQSFFDFLGTSIALTSTLATLVGGFLIFVGTVLQVGGVVFTVVGTLLNFQLVISSLIAFVAAFATGILALTAAVVVFLPLITVLTSVFETFYQVFTQNAGNASTAAQAFFGTVRSTAETFFNFIRSFLNVLGVFVGRTAESGDALQSIGAAIAGFFGSLAQFFTSGFLGNVRIALGQLTQIFDAFASISSLTTQIADLTFQFGQISGQNLFGRIAEQELTSPIEEQLATLRESLKTTISNLVQNVPLFRNAVQSLFGDTSDASIQAFVDRILGTLTNLGQALNGIKDSFINFFTNLASEGGIKDALGKFFTELNVNLGNLIFNLLSLFTDFFGSNEILDALKASVDEGEGFSSFAIELIGQIVTAIYNAILANRNNLKDLFLGVVDFFFAGLKNLRFITDLLGAGPISDLFESFQGVLRQLLGNVFDVLFNLLEGQDLGEALYNVFGEAIQPLFDLIDAVKNIGTTLGSAFSALFTAIFPSDTNLLEAAENAFDFQGFLDGITGFLNSFNELFLTPLLQGDFGAIWQRIVDGVVNFFTGIFDALGPEISNLITTGSTFFSDFIAGLGTAFQTFVESVDTPEEILALGQSILGMILGGIGAAIDTFEILTGIDVNKLLTDIASYFQNIVLVQGPTAFSSLADTILDTLFEALNTAIANLEDALNIDFQPAIDKISESFSNLLTALDDLLNSTAPKGGTSLLQDIINIIVALADAIKGLFDAFPEDSDTPNEPLQFIVNFAADIIALGIDTITDFVTAINDLFDFLKTADPEAILALGVAIGLLLAPFIAPALIAGITALSAAFLGLVSTVFTVVIPFLALFVVVRALLQNVDELLQVFTKIGKGDFSGALTELGDALLNIFADITEQVGPLINMLLGFFGLAPLNFDSDAVVELGHELYDSFLDAGKALEISFDRIMADWGAFFSIWITDLRDAVLGIRDLNREQATNFFEQDDFTLQGLADINASTNNKEYLQALAVLDQEEISKQIREEIGQSIAEGDPFPVTASDIIVLRDLEVLSRTLEDAIFSGDLGVAEALVESSVLTPAELQEFSDNLEYAVEQGYITAEEAITLVQEIEIDPVTAAQNGVDPAEAQAILDQTEADLQASLTGQEPAVVEADVDVQLNPDTDGDGIVTAEEAAAAAEAEVAAAQEELNRQAPVPVYVPYEVVLVSAGGETAVPVTDPKDREQAGEAAAPETAPAILDIEGTNASDVAALTADLQALQSFAQLVKTDVDALLPSLSQLGTDLTTVETAFATINTTSLIFSNQLTSLNLSLTTMLLNIALLLVNLSLLGLGFTLAGTVAVSALTQIELKFIVLHNMLLVLLQTMIQGFIDVKKVAEQLAKTLAGIVADAQNIATTVNETNDQANQQGGGGEDEGSDGPHAHGGSFSGRNKRRGYGKYQVGEGGSEVLFENGKMYLLSRGEGQIATLAQGLPELRNDASTGLYPNMVGAGAGAGTSNISNVTVEGATIEVNINGASGDPQAIADEVIQRIDAHQKNQNHNVRRNLRLNHRG